MRKILFLALAPLFFVSCDKKERVDYAADVAGTYTVRCGIMDVAEGGTRAVRQFPGTLEFARIDDDNIRLKLTLDFVGQTVVAAMPVAGVSGSLGNVDVKSGDTEIVVTGLTPQTIYLDGSVAGTVKDRVDVDAAGAPNSGQTKDIYLTATVAIPLDQDGDFDPEQEPVTVTFAIINPLIED